MKVRVKLYGTLRRCVPDYRHEDGIEVEIPDGARVKDLLAHLEIPESRKGIVAMEGRIMRPDDKLVDGASVNVLQPVFGG